jgi:hypothetical protein
MIKTVRSVFGCSAQNKLKGEIKMAYMYDYITEMNQRNLLYHGVIGAIQMLFDDIFKTKKNAFIEEEINEYNEALQEILGQITRR